MDTSEPPFQVTCSGGYREDGAWLVQAALRFPGGLAAARPAVVRRGRADLLKAIGHEGRRGRGLGAKTIRVRVDEGDGEVEELDLAHVIARLSPD